jgi:hypothetical protein
MRSSASLIAALAVLSPLSVAACGDEASAVRGTWGVSRLTVGFSPNADCTDLSEVVSNDAGTMTFNDVPHPDGIADHTFTYSLTQVADAERGEIVAAEPPREGSAGWTPDDGKEETAGFTVTDPVNASMAGLWNILESAVGAVNVEQFFVEELGDGASQCTRSEYFLIAP